MKRILFLNGPPRSGKDTLGRLLQGALLRSGWLSVSFKYAKLLKERTHALYGSSAPHDAFEETKDEPNDLFLGLTPRQAYIAVSEKYMKPVHGEDVFGRLLRDELVAELRGHVAIITDSGFRAEAAPIIEEYGIEQCLLIRLARAGCTFEGDSRSYWGTPGLDEDGVQNDGDMAALELAAHEIVNMWVTRG